MKNIKIEKIGNIQAEYSYLEVFLENSNPFLEVSITHEKQLLFTFYSSLKDIHLNIEDWEFIFVTAKDFLIKEIKNEDDFLNTSDSY